MSVAPVRIEVFINGKKAVVTNYRLGHMTYHPKHTQIEIEAIMLSEEPSDPAEVFQEIIK